MSNSEEIKDNFPFERKMSYKDFVKSVIEGLLSGDINKQKATEMWMTLINEIQDPMREKILVKCLNYFLTNGEGIVINLAKDKYIVFVDDQILKSFPLPDGIKGKDKKDGDFLVTDVFLDEDGIISFKEPTLN